MTKLPESLASRQFRSVLVGVSNKEVLVPRLRAFFSGVPAFPVVSIPIRRFERREADGWFHPSEHPMWTARQLYYYLVNSTNFHSRELDVVGVLAVTQGVFWHYFIQAVMEDLGLLRVIDSKGENSWDRVECPVEDKRLRSRGSMDGIINSDNIPVLEHDESFEFKSMSVNKMSGCPQGPPDAPARLAWWKEKNPGYYFQSQEYLRLSGLAATRVLIMGIQAPFPMIELRVPYSYTEASKTADKYALAVQGAADGVPPDPCCNIGSAQARDCFVRYYCPVGRGEIV